MSAAPVLKAVNAAEDASSTPLGNAESQEIAALHTQLETIQAHIGCLTEQLGAAVVDDDDQQVEELEQQLDSLIARRKGLVAEIAQREASASATHERERRRAEAAERERCRRELAGLQRQFYEGWSALLEHRARIALLTRELERLRGACPVELSTLATLQRQLEERGVSVDTPVRDLEECSDPARIQSAVQHYRELADLAGSLAIPAEHRPDDPPGGPSDSAARAGGPENEADEAGQAEELARLEDLEQRLLGLQATFTKREYQRPALQEVERQLARVRAAQKSLASDGKKHPAGMFGSMLGLAKRP